MNDTLHFYSDTITIELDETNNTIHFEAQYAAHSHLN